MKTRDHTKSGPSAEEQRLSAEVERLNKIVQVLMDRSERMTGEAVSEYGFFQRKIVLGEVVQKQTEELRQALSRNEKTERRLRVSEAKFRGVAEQSLVGIAVVEGGRLTFANARFAQTFGYTPDEITALPLMSTVTEASHPVFNEHLRGCESGESKEMLLDYRGRRKDGSIVDVELSSSQMQAGDKSALILVVEDVTAKKEAERKVKALNRRLSEMAIRDPLTGLYNRRFMEASLERELLQAERGGYPLSLVMGDIDHFKLVNDEHGHQVGDEVLKAFSSLLGRHCRKSDIACRFGGEEFLLVLPGMPVGLAADWAERARAATTTTPIAVASGSFNITASFGVANFPAHGQTWQEVISAADAALYAAKSGGRNQVKRAPFPLSVPVSEDETRRPTVSRSRSKSANLALLFGTRM